MTDTKCMGMLLTARHYLGALTRGEDTSRSAEYARICGWTQETISRWATDLDALREAAS